MAFSGSSQFSVIHHISTMEIIKVLQLAHTFAEAILGGIKVDNCLLITNDIMVWVVQL